MNYAVLDAATIPKEWNLTLPPSPGDRYAPAKLKTVIGSQATSLPPAISKHSLAKSNDFPLLLIVAPLFSAICLAFLSGLYFFKNRPDAGAFFFFFTIMLVIATATSLLTRKLVAK